MMKIKRLLLPTLLISAIYHAQTLPAARNETEEDEDIEYELRHKSQPRFSEMKDNVDYFKVKSQFRQVFWQSQVGKSKPRSIGEDWLRTKLFYLDNQGKLPLNLYCSINLK